jgi:hypothetical protein
MRVVLDTNVLVSALLDEASPPAQLLGLWRQGRFSLVTAAEQLDELKRVTRYPKIRARLTAALAGRLVNEIRDVAVVLQTLPFVERSRDPYDNYILAIAEAAQADYLVTGDKAGLLALKQHGTARIVTVTAFGELLR